MFPDPPFLLLSEALLRVRTHFDVPTEGAEKALSDQIRFARIRWCGTDESGRLQLPLGAIWNRALIAWSESRVSWTPEHGPAICLTDVGVDTRMLRNWLDKSPGNDSVATPHSRKPTGPGARKARKRGKKPELRKRVIAAMKADLKRGSFSREEFADTKEEALVSRYGVKSRETVRLARDAVLAETKRPS